MQLAWDKDASSADVRGALALIDEHLDVGEVFQRTELPRTVQGQVRGHTTFRLTSMVCYYGQVGRGWGGGGLGVRV